MLARRFFDVLIRLLIGFCLGFLTGLIIDR